MSRTIKAGHVYRQYSKDGMPIADYKSSRLAHEATGKSSMGTDSGGLKQQDRIP